ncbi:hypothetical protein WAF17_10075 [Bernardetia sp. ABR2-2B]|uniref:hypothetical protein n=1 Tax=Bernardetia sp. ABR2-2B TaxID=3127472 RepID=UPI0030D62E9F
MQNEGYSAEAIKIIRDKALKEGRDFVINEDIERTPESVCFYFTGEYKGNAVVFDACLFALRVEHEMQVFALAEERVEDTFPDFNLEVEMENEESESMEYFDEKVAEIEENQEIQVSEYIDFDEAVEYGVGLDVCLKVKEVTDETVAKFISSFNKGTFKLDPKEYTFKLEEFGA